MGSLRSRQSTRGLSNRPADARGRLSCHDGALLLGGSDGQAISTRTLLGRLGTLQRGQRLAGRLSVPERVRKMRGLLWAAVLSRAVPCMKL